MNDVVRSFPMIVALCYLVWLTAVYLRLRNSKIAKSLISELFLGLNVSTVLILIVRGLPLFVNGMRPSWVVSIAAVLFCILVLFGNVEMTGNLFLDSFLVSCGIVSVASIMPAGIWWLYREGMTMNLCWIWLIIALAVAVIAKSIHWLEEGR